METRKIIAAIQHTGFKFFQDFTNFKDEKGYGLTVDHTGNLDLASIASTGFFLSSLVLGVQAGYMTADKALSQAIKTCHTLAYNVPHFHGFFYHFLNIHTAERSKKCEYSTIDTALALNGVITVDAFFKDQTLHQLATMILSRVDWSILIHYKEKTPRLYMAYNPDADGDYVNGRPGYIHHWSMLAEQLMMYVMLAGQGKIDRQLALDLYHGFERKQVTYKNIQYYYTPGNTLFVYQYPQCWFDLKQIYDDQGISWFENTKQAIRGHYALSRDTVKTFPTFAEDYFGFTASYGLKGYQVSAAIPNVNNKLHHDGIVAPNAMIGSLIFTPELAEKAILKMYQRPELWSSDYGFINAFVDGPPLWTSSRYLSIDKGLEMLMANAYLTKTVMQAYMAHPLILQGMETLQWKKIK